MKAKPNMREGNKHAAAREWAYELLAASPGTTGSEMAGLMAEQFKQTKNAMSHTLGQMMRVGILKSNGLVTYNGKRTHALSVNSRRKRILSNGNGAAEHAPSPTPLIVNTSPSVAPMMLAIPTAAGDMTLTIAQARELYVTLGELFK